MRTNVNSKIGCMVAALALTSPATAAPAGLADQGALVKAIKCIGAGAYNGPFMAPYRPPQWVTGLNGKFMHISDIHIDELYADGSDPATMCHRPNATNPEVNVAGKYGALGSICDTPQVLLDSTFKWMADNTPDMDFILYTGDSARHDRDKKVPRQHSEVLNEHKIVVDKVLSTFDSKVKFIPTFGNNDELDYNKMAPVEDPIISKLTEIWSPLGLGLESNAAWKKGGYFSYEVKPGLVVVNLNSMLLFASNVLTKDCSVTGSAGTEMLAWMEAELATIRSQGKKAYVMQHIPPTDVMGKALYFPGCQSKYINLIGQNADVILGSFFGHTNSDYMSFIYTNNTESPSDGPFFLSTVTDAPPTVDFDNTCVIHAMSQAPAIIPANNPAVRVYTYSTSTRSFGALIKYVQYWSDLVQDNKNDEVTYAVEYSTSDTFDMWNLSPFSWTRALKDWATNSTNFQDYVRFRFVQNPKPILKG
jgi:hypothetical protein